MVDFFEIIINKINERPMYLTKYSVKKGEMI